MRRRSLFLFLLLLGLARGSPGDDAVAVRISHFGLEGIYAPNGEPSWVQVEARNNTNQPISLNLVVAEVSLDNGALPISERITLPLALAASETRSVDLPVRVVPYNHAVLSVEAHDEGGIPLGRTGLLVGPKIDGQVIALLCTTPELCRAIRQSILLSGSAEEQTRKSQFLRLIQLSVPPPTNWAYSPASIVVVAAPVAQFSTAQRDALEVYLHRGGQLLLVENQLAEPPATSDHPRFLDVYRTHVGEDKLLRVGEGEFARIKTVSSREFSDYFRPLGFSSSTPGEIRQQLKRYSGVNTPSEPGQLNTWLIRRLGTTFHFPSFLELLCWIIGYLLLVGIVNFIVLRRLGRPEWAWISIPALAVLFSVLLYAVGARNHPSNFGLDEMTVYRLDSLSPLAITNTRIRISAPVRSIVRPVLPGDLVQTFGQRNAYGNFEEVAFSFPGNLASSREIQLGKTWESSIPLRRWSFHDLNFEGQRRFAGTVFRDSSGRLHNATGLSYRQAIVVDRRDVFYLGEFPAGAVVDLAHVSYHPYEQEAGRRTSNNVPNYPAPPFQFRRLDQPDPVSEEEQKRFDEEFKTLSTHPFELAELFRGWSRRGENVFSDTKSVFFGLSSEATVGAVLRDRAPDRKAYSLTVVTFGDWP
jgi:hypothetical protein